MGMGTGKEREREWMGMGKGRGGEWKGGEAYHQEEYTFIGDGEAMGMGRRRRN